MLDVMALMNFNRKISTAFDDLELEASLDDEGKEVFTLRWSTPDIDIGRFIVTSKRQTLPTQTTLAIHLRNQMVDALSWLRKSVNEKLDPHGIGLKKLIYIDGHYKETVDKHTFWTDDGLVVWKVNQDAWSFNVTAEINIVGYA